MGEMTEAVVVVSLPTERMVQPITDGYVFVAPMPADNQDETECAAMRPYRSGVNRIHVRLNQRSGSTIAIGATSSAQIDRL